MTVPASVPSLRHSSVPSMPSSAAKYRSPLNSVKSYGFGAVLTGIDILNHHRSGRRAIGLPKFAAVNAIIGGEIHGVADGQQLVRLRPDCESCY